MKRAPFKYLISDDFMDSANSVIQITLVFWFSALINQNVAWVQISVNMNETSVTEIECQTIDMIYGHPGMVIYHYFQITFNLFDDF